MQRLLERESMESSKAAPQFFEYASCQEQHCFSSCLHSVCSLYQNSLYLARETGQTPGRHGVGKAPHPSGTLRKFRWKHDEPVQYATRLEIWPSVNYFAFGELPKLIFCESHSFIIHYSLFKAMPKNRNFRKHFRLQNLTL